ncbi:MAG: transglutaminase family protein [Desulfocapsaceae bacterium]|jgi:transglutaminase-like putative cysteine protease|nr:transglutaminase family protein [Desulfocapsaceae bacterium]
MKLRTSCKLLFDISVATPFVLMLRPRSGAQQWVARDELTIVPDILVSEFTDSYGNLCQRLVAPPGVLSIYSEATVHTADNMDREPGAPFVEIQNLPDEVLQYLLPSRYCEIEDFGQFASDLTAEQRPGYDQVSAIEQWIRSSIHYDYNNSDSTVSAREVHSRKSGVCRDLAHLGIALCRSLAIPARMVVGYLHELEPIDMHAWFEAFVAGRWYTFDATQPYLRDGYVVLGIGRDAADVAVYNQFGPPIFPMSQDVLVERIDEKTS